MTETFPSRDTMPERIDPSTLQPGMTVSYYWRESDAWHGPTISHVTLILGHLSVWRGTRSYKITSGRIHISRLWPEDDA